MEANEVDAPQRKSMPSMSAQIGQKLIPSAMPLLGKLDFQEWNIMNTGTGGCSVVIMGALAVILGGRHGFIGITAGVAVVGTVATASGEDKENE
ncbi:MAG: hypothetical protein HOE66_00510 [Planctomycetes bacterium]|nr:hypothetical protein [Planctomycetota bacterium]